MPSLADKKKLVADAYATPPQLFPAASYDSMEMFCEDYAAMWQLAMQSLDKRQMALAADALTEVITSRRVIYVCGNGGSAAISNHLLCDFLKGMQTHTELLPKVVSLSANLELGLAIANDISFEDIFAYPLRTMAEPGDLLLSISSSGDSENVVRAVAWARENGLRTIAMTGFEGGRSRAMADISLHIEARNYGLVEDCHHALMHMLAQYVRLRHMNAKSIGQVKF